MIDSTTEQKEKEKRNLKVAIFKLPMLSAGLITNASNLDNV